MEVGLVLITGVGYYTYGKIKNRPKLKKDYWGLNLGSTKEDILFLKGKPQRKLTELDGDYWEYDVRTYLMGLAAEFTRVPLYTYQLSERR